MGDRAVTSRARTATSFHAYVVKPVDFDPAKKYPVAFLIHGGPQGSFGNDFHYRWNRSSTPAPATPPWPWISTLDRLRSAFQFAIRGDWAQAARGPQKGLDAAAALPVDGRTRVAALARPSAAYMTN